MRPVSALMLALLALSRPCLSVAEEARRFTMTFADEGGLERQQGDLGVRVDGTRMIVAEPVGPARTALGDAGKRSRAHVRGGLARKVSLR